MLKTNLQIIPHIYYYYLVKEGRLPIDNIFDINGST